jgi:hypothetical protein
LHLRKTSYEKNDRRIVNTRQVLCLKANSKLLEASSRKNNDLRVSRFLVKIKSYMTTSPSILQDVCSKNDKPNLVVGKLNDLEWLLLFSIILLIDLSLNFPSSCVQGGRIPTSLTEMINDLFEVA